MTHPVPITTATTDDSARSGTSYDLNIPAADSSGGAGDTILVFLCSEYGTAGAFAPGGSWDVIYDLQVPGSGLDNPATALCMVKKATGSEGATETITVQSASTYATAHRITDAADPTVKPPEYIHAISTSDSTPHCHPILPSAKIIDDYLVFRAHHTTRSFTFTYPLPDSQVQVGGDCRVGSCCDQLTGFSFEDTGYFGGATTFWTALTSRVVVYPATSYTHPADDLPHIDAVEVTDDSSLTAGTLVLNLPAGIASGNVLLSVVTQEVVAGSSSDDGFTWPAGWNVLYNRVQRAGTFFGTAAIREADGTEGATVNLSALPGGELSAITYLFSQAQGLKVDFRIDEGTAAFDSVRWKTLTPLGGQDNFIFVAAAHLPNQPRATSQDSDYSSYGRADSTGTAISTRFAHYAVNASSESPGALDLTTEGEYLTGVFAIYSDSQVAGEVRSTQASAQFLFEQANNDARVTQAVAQYLFQQVTSARVTQIGAQALVAMIPCIRRRCQVWKITRRDGTEYLYTTHDEAVTFHGDTYQPCNSLRASAAEAGTLNQVGGGDIQIRGLISADEITERDMVNGLFDGAEVEVWEVPWNDASLASDSPKRLLKGSIGQTMQSPNYYEAEVFTRSAKLAQNPLLDAYTPACRFKPGDGNCPIDVAALTTHGSVEDVVTRIARDRRSHRQFYSTGPGAFGSSSSSSGEEFVSWDYGLLTWLTGDNVGIQAEIKEIDSDLLVTLWDSMPNEIAVADTFKVEPGCARTQDAHTTTWGFDLESFGGFPDIPGLDSLVRGPRR